MTRPLAPSDPPRVGAQVPAGRTALLLLVAAALAMSLLLARACPLVDPDEGRNAEIAREMTVDGDLVVPHLAGMPYLDKPPAFFWAAALAIRAFGNTPWAARLPAALAAAATLLLLGGLALREHGQRFALSAVALLATAPLFAVLSAYVIFDMPLALCVTTVWVGLVRELRDGPRARRRLAMFAAVAAGVLLKGPVMLAWALGGGLAAALIERSRQPLRWLGWWPGWIFLVGVAGGWFALACLRYPEYPRYAFLEESLERVATGAFRREQPLWFVPAVLIVGALPWSLVTPWGRGLSRAGRVALGFVLFAAVIFTLSRSKLVTYLLPALPCLAWLATEAWCASGRARRGAVATAVFYALLAAALGAMALSGRMPAAAGPPGQLPPSPAPLAIGLAADLALLALVAAGAALARRPSLAFLGVVAFTPLVLLVTDPALVRFAAAQSGAPLASSIRLRAGSQATVRYEGCYSPGTDYLLGHRSAIVSVLGHETASNYQVRYRRALMGRGQWTLLPAAPAAGAEIIVRPAGRVHERLAGFDVFFVDGRFAAWHPTPAAR